MILPQPQQQVGLWTLAQPRLQALRVLQVMLKLQWMLAVQVVLRQQVTLQHVPTLLTMGLGSTHEQRSYLANSFSNVLVSAGTGTSCAAGDMTCVSAREAGAPTAACSSVLDVATATPELSTLVTAIEVRFKLCSAPALR